MLLDRIDIDSHGPLNRVELGPFAEHLNVICGPEGSGKTAIARFIRDSLISREYPLGMMSSSAGRVVWADQHGKVHCRRELDGTPTGRRTIDFESRGDSIQQYGALRHSWIANVGRTNDAMHSADSLSLPESIVDGVITDSAVTSVARVVSACVRSGLDDPRTYQSLPIATDSAFHDRGTYTGHEFSGHNDARENDQRRRLRSELADVEAELARLNQTGQSTTANYDQLSRRRNELTSRLAARTGLHEVRQTAAYTVNKDFGASRRGGEARLESLYEQSRQLRARRSELSRWIDELDRDVTARRATSTGHPYSGNYPAGYASSHVAGNYETHAAAIDADLRRRLDDLDAQMIHWRRTLIEVRGLREAIVAARGHLSQRYDVPPRRQHMDQFMQSVDRYDRNGNLEQIYGDASRANVPLEDIELRIDSATRQLDWLLDRYAKGDNLTSDWYRADAGYHTSPASTTLADTLSAIRADLRVVQTRTSQYATDTSANFASRTHVNEIEELTRNERWLTAAIDQLIRHRESLLGETHLKGQVVRKGAYATQGFDWTHARYQQERSERIAELQTVKNDLEACVREAARVRREMREMSGFKRQDCNVHFSAHVDHSVQAISQAERDSIVAELRRIDDQLASQSRVQWLTSRRAELTRQLGAVRHTPSVSPLAEAASRWLVRLSAGRLTRVEWSGSAFAQTRGIDGHYVASRPNAHLVGSGGVRINGIDENQVAAADRALASMAVRMAAGDLLARTGRAIPLVFETHRELLQYAPVSINPVASGYQAAVDPHFAAYRDHNFHGDINHPIAAALHDYARAGHQVILLTSSHELSSQVQRSGGRVFNLHAERTIQPHRPLWRPHYASEKYVGPHPHTYGTKSAPDHRAVDFGELNHVTADPYTAAYVDRAYGAMDYARSGYPRYAAPRPTGSVRPQATYFADPNSSPVDINRDFDTAWREAYGVYDNPQQFRNHSLPQTELATDGIAFRDGYYFADSYTTSGQAVSGRAVSSHTVNHEAAIHSNASQDRHSSAIAPIRKVKTPFFLTVDSPIDQAPSVDAVAAARLRGLDVTHITHLMSQDPNRLSDSLGLANVDADTIRHWQSECRLVCRVPQLRGFDARVLVGCGIFDPAQLSSIHPVDLLQRVESFLATGAGQRILLSGSSQELSRITSWIAAANASDNGHVGLGFANQQNMNGRTANGHTIDGRVIRDADSRYEFDSDRYEYEAAGEGNGNNGGPRRRRRIRTIGSDAAPRSIFGNDRDRDYDRDGEYVRSQGNGRSRSAASGNGSGNGRADGYGSGNGSGSGNGNGSGNGYGTPNRSNGHGTPNRSSGNGVGRGRGAGSGSGSGSGNGSGRGKGNGSGSGTGRSRRNGNSNVVRIQREPREYTRSEREPREYTRAEREPREYTRTEREPREYTRTEREPRKSRERSEREPRTREDTEQELRFYLDRSSPVVDAPSIGSRMAARLEAVGIHTVDDLINADPDTVASNLDHRRIDAATILSWQQQATLVCRIPMLRGHDAQLLVAADVTTPEEVAVYEPNDLLGLILPIAKSSEGKRILRGGKMPDLEEMNDWIKYAALNRDLVAA